MDLREMWRLASDEELLRVAQRPEALNEEAKLAVTEEVARRGLEIRDPASAREKSPSTTSQAPADFPFFPVGPTKLVVLSICTLNFYLVYWLYQNWKSVKDGTGAPVSPFWRAAFGPLWAFALFRLIQQRAKSSGVPVTWQADVLGVIFFALSFAYRLPDPFALISFASVFVLVPVQATVRQLNEKIADPAVMMDANEQFSPANLLAVLVGGLFLLLVIAATFLPATPQP